MNNRTVLYIAAVAGLLVIVGAILATISTGTARTTGLVLLILGGIAVVVGSVGLGAGKSRR